MMHLKPTIPLVHHSTIPFLLALILATGCDRLPGKPTPEERWKASDGSHGFFPTLRPELLRLSRCRWTPGSGAAVERSSLSGPG